MNKVDLTEYGTPTIKEFLSKFNAVANECSVDGVTVSSHRPLSTEVIVRDEDYNTFKIVGIDVITLGGCGCWSGVEIVVKKED